MAKEQLNEFRFMAEWRSPSNIAIVKYWGKKGFQLPANPSISMTLNRSVSETKVTLNEKPDNSAVSFDLFFEGVKNEKFESKIKPFLELASDRLGFIKDYQLKIETQNTFPHSAGIASSASGMSALSLCLWDLYHQIYKTDLPDEEFLQNSSHLSRLGSGSACRSIYGNWVLWGKTDAIETSSDNYAIPFDFNIGDDFTELRDSILMVSSKEKSVSSRAGHSLMDHHPYSESRYLQANKHIYRLIDALKNNDWDSFAQITENEALSLHSLMLNSEPWFMLLQPESISIIKRVREFRESTKVKVCFTIDAGPNIHLLYPESERKIVIDFIETELSPYLENKLWIDDGIGNGPEKINTDKL